MNARVLVFSAVVVLSGCATGPDPALVAQSALIGMPKEELLSCAGVPARQTTSGEREFLTYSGGRLEAGPAQWDTAPWRRGWGPSNYLVTSAHCEANFTLRDGKVERLVYGGDATRGDLSSCRDLVAACLPPAPVAP